MTGLFPLMAAMGVPGGADAGMFAPIFSGTTGRLDPEGVGIWVAAILTFAIYSFLYHDNPVYKLAEHLFVGVSAGYAFMNLWEQIIMNKALLPLRGVAAEYYHIQKGDAAAELIAWAQGAGWAKVTLFYGAKGFFFYFLPTLIGFLILARLYAPAMWVAKYPIAIVIGYGSGQQIITTLGPNVIQQMYSSVEPIANFKSVWAAGGHIPPFAVASYMVFIIGLGCAAFYFYFSAEHKGPLMGPASRVGIFVLMITFGAQFGFTIMARISLLIGRFQFLLGQWLHVLPPS